MFLFLLILPAGVSNAQQPVKERWRTVLTKKKQKADSIYQVADSLMTEYRVVERLDSMITAKHSKKKFDSLYIARPDARWTFKTRLKFAGTHIASQSVDEGVKSSTSLDTDLKSSISFGVAYRGIGFGFGLNPAKLFNKHSDVELSLDSYGQKIGFDMTYLRAGSFKGSAKIGNKELTLERGFLHQTLFSVNAFYVFNNRRFSYAAAFTQSYDQKRSAGSLLAGISYLSMRAKNERDAALELSGMRIYMGHIGLGVGYAYNLVLSHNWLIHASTLPTVVIVNRNNMTIDGERTKMPFYFPSVISSGRLAAIHYFKHYFAGITTVVNTSVIGRSNRLLLTHTNWLARVVVGMRL